MGEERTGRSGRRRKERVRLRVLTAVALTHGIAFFGGSVTREPRLALPVLCLAVLWGLAFLSPLAWLQFSLVRKAAELATSTEEVRQLMDTAIVSFVGALGLAALPGVRRAGGRPHFTGQPASILFLDIVGFGSPERTDADRAVVHDAMYRSVNRACARAGISWTRCHLEDRGDGILLVLPLPTPTQRALSPFLLPLAEFLAEHNRGATEGTRLQLRAVQHKGPVRSAWNAVRGEAVIHAARLLDAPPAKDEQRRVGADLTFVASALVYETIVRHSLDGLEPGSYQRFTARVKESELTGWLCLLGVHRRTLLLHLEGPGQLFPRTYVSDGHAEKLA